MRASTWDADTVPRNRPSVSTTTPRPLGEESAASSAARSVPSTVASVPPRLSKSGVTGACKRFFRNAGQRQPTLRPVLVVDDKDPTVVSPARCLGQVQAERHGGLVRSGKARRP